MVWKFKTCERCEGTGKEIDDAATGKVLREQRESLNVSLRRLAFVCNWSAAYVSDLELGHRRWNEEKLARYVEALEAFK